MRLEKDVYPKFILSDNYVGINFLNGGGSLKNQNIFESEVEIYCPISSDICVCFYPKESRGGMNFDFSVEYISERDSKFINYIIFSQRDRYAYGAEGFELLRLYSTYPRDMV